MELGGNEDNAFAHKITTLGNEFKIYPFEIFHLFHSHKTIKNDNIKNKWFEIKTWNKEKWLSEIDKIKDNWGN